MQFCAKSAFHQGFWARSFNQKSPRQAAVNGLTVLEMFFKISERLIED